MSTSNHQPTLTRTGSHFVNPSRRDFREEVYLYFETVWRGAPAFVTMQADRYQHSSGVSEWRIYAQEARKAEWGANHTETARQRLSGELRPLVEAWLESDAYRVSESDAYFRAVREMLRDARPYLSDPTRDMREALAQCRDKLNPEQIYALEAMADAYATFCIRYNATAEARS